jgi:hypothetical protein
LAGAEDQARSVRPKRATGRLILKILKQIFLFGKLALPETSGCAKVVEIMRDMSEQRTFASGRRQRKEFLTYAQAERHCEASHREGFGSIALAQAFMFDLGMRQKDMIGEWVPRSEPGVTDVFNGGSKWLMGARWEEIDEQFVWKHRLSKSVTREGIMDLETGKTELFELLEFPLVRRELVNRAAQPRQLPSVRPCNRQREHQAALVDQSLPRPLARDCPQGRHSG